MSYNNKSTIDTISSVPRRCTKGMCRSGNSDTIGPDRYYTDTFLKHDIPGSSVLTQGSFWNMIIIQKDKLIATRGLGHEEYEYDIVQN